MTRIVPLTVVAGALACLLAVGSAQAAPVSSAAVGKLADVSHAASVVDQVHYRRHHRRWWKWKYYRRDHHHRHHRSHRRHRQYWD